MTIKFANINFEEFMDFFFESTIGPMLDRIKTLEERADLADLERRLAEPDFDGDSDHV